MNPLTNTPARTSNERYISSPRKDTHLRIPPQKQSLKSSLSALSIAQLVPKPKHETTLISNLTSNYYHSFVYSLFSHLHKYDKVQLMHESTLYEVEEVKLEIVLPSPYFQDIWAKRKEITQTLSRGSILLDDGHELFFYFSFINDDKTAIQILDIPFIMLSLVEIHQQKLKALVQGASHDLEKRQNPFDIKYELSSFKIMIEYLVQKEALT